jgi:hypothetical protein
MVMHDNETQAIADSIRTGYSQLKTLQEDLARAEADLRISQQETDRRGERVRGAQRRYDEASDLLKDIWGYYRSVRETLDA